MESKVTKTKNKKTEKIKSIRISLETENKLEKILAVANKKKIGRKVKADKVVQMALGLLSDQHIESLQKAALTNEDRKELLRQKYIELRGPISKDDFTGFILSKEVFSFYEEANIQ